MKYLKFLCLLVIIGALLCVAAYAESNVSNTFVGTVDGEKIVAYLDTSYVTNYHDGFDDDLDALFVSFDNKGMPKYRIGVRILESTKKQTYSNKSGKKADYLCIRMEYRPDDHEFKDYYRIIEGATKWSVNFTKVDRKNGVFKGTVDAKLTPSKYNHSPYPKHKSVHVEGSFEFQAGTVHPVMQEYRAINPSYAERYDFEFYNSIGTYTDVFQSGSKSGSKSSSSSSNAFCNYCGNSRKCYVCHGVGFIYTIDLGAGDGKSKCSICSGSGICRRCK